MGVSQYLSFQVPPRPLRGMFPYGHPPARVRPAFLRPQTFDQYFSEADFPRDDDSDELLNKAILARNKEIAPSAKEQSAVTTLMAQVKSALETIISTQAIPSAKITEVKEIGSFKTGTMISKKNIADVVLMFGTLPTHQTVKALGERIVELLKETQLREVYGVVPRDYGCEVAGTQAVLRLMIAVPPELPLQIDSALHLKPEVLKNNIMALKHATWFDDNAGQPAIKILVRIIKDIRTRCEGLKPLDMWTIQLLSHYCVTHTADRKPLPLAHAFRRFFQLLSSGFLLHCSVGVADPCDPTRRINYGFSLQEADLICRTCQFICRLIIHEKFDCLFGLNGNVSKDVASENETDDGLNIAPLKEAFFDALLINKPSQDKFFSKNVTA
ncbi:unnamed protein product [Bursaphelenchus okinawaensis]|uniref:DZF domain-containing protein n=1 Tax=Bursaphelenchus okinawaensis TaxID=465554 RepID=A0A811LCX6_9BILA|nr:unnamed protein product [Bursaphelenchus okinawaensis]CAG9120335.1 unnamed protein product [Bursaphelenchus okinawaensis]